MRILEGRAADNYVRKVERRGQRLDELEPRVRRIVQSVRRNGDKALRRYAERWDGLGPGDALRVSEDEMQAALKSSSPRTAICARDCGQATFAVFVHGKSLANGCERSRAGSWASWCVLSVPWDVMCPADAIPCPPLC